MEYLVVAELEIDGVKVDHYTQVSLVQKFNHHHEFSIRINHDVLENTHSASLENAQKKIGKSALIKLQQLNNSSQTAYEFRGIICEVRMEQSGNSNADLIFSGYSPTILLENGTRFDSFNDYDLKKIVSSLSKSLSEVNCEIYIDPKFTNTIKYICQYRESNFNFISRLSAEYSEYFYYDGKAVYFGKPAPPHNVHLTYGEDLISMQMKLQAIPMKFKNYAYLSKENKMEEFESPGNIEGLGMYASNILKESDSLFSEAIILPINQRVQSKSELEDFVKKKKAAQAASLEILTGTSYNPSVKPGCNIDVKISKLEDQKYVVNDYGKYLVTEVSHFVNERGKYYNTFLAIPASVEVLPDPGVLSPLAEPQLAIVKDNKDPDNQGRVRVQMLWQSGNKMTDWIRVLTPDAGIGKDSGKNRGFLFIPEVGDQVLLNFRYNDPDRPVVVGSLFHGKSGEGGGDKNKLKSLSSLSGNIISFEGDAIHIVDATGNNKILLDGKGNISLISTESIKLTCDDSEISMKKDGTIDIVGKDITINGSSFAKMESGSAVFTAESSGEAKVEAINIKQDAQATIKVGSGATTDVTAGAVLKLESALVTIN